MKIHCTKQMRRLAALAAAALLLAGCGKPASSGSSSGASGSSGSAGAAGSPADGWKAGLAVLTESEAGDAGGEVHTVAAAVVLDEDGRILHAVVDELETKVDAAEGGGVTLPEDLRTKRQKGDEDYPLKAVSAIGKGWADQADALARHLKGMTVGEVAKLETDEDGYAADPDLLAGCTIKIDRYRDAVAEACRQAKPL